LLNVVNIEILLKSITLFDNKNYNIDLINYLSVFTIKYIY